MIDWSSVYWPQVVSQCLDAVVSTCWTSAAVRRTSAGRGRGAELSVCLGLRWDTLSSPSPTGPSTSPTGRGPASTGRWGSFFSSIYDDSNNVCWGKCPCLCYVVLMRDRLRSVPDQSNFMNVKWAGRRLPERGVTSGFWFLWGFSPDACLWLTRGFLMYYSGTGSSPCCSVSLWATSTVGPPWSPMSQTPRWTTWRRWTRCSSPPASTARGRSRPRFLPLYFLSPARLRSKY